MFRPFFALLKFVDQQVNFKMKVGTLEEKRMEQKGQSIPKAASNFQAPVCVLCVAKLAFDSFGVRKLRNAIMHALEIYFLGSI